MGYRIWDMGGGGRGASPKMVDRIWEIRGFVNVKVRVNEGNEERRWKVRGLRNRSGGGILGRMSPSI